MPDHSTLSRFRSELSRRGLAERLLAELNRQLDARGLMVKSGTLIDASLVEADCRRPKKGEPAEGRSDKDASWNAMPEKPLFGYKMHLAVDHGSGLVRRAILDFPATSRTRSRFLDLVQGDERAVYADRGYDGWWYRREPARPRHRPWHDDGQLPAAAARCRRPRPQPHHRADPGADRAHLRRSLKRWYGYRRVRYRSLINLALQLQLLAPRPEPAPRARADRLRVHCVRTTAAATLVAAPRAAAGRHVRQLRALPPPPGRS